MTNNVKALLAWLLGIVGGIVFLATEKDDKLIRLHAAQSLVSFGAYFVLVIATSIVGFGAGLVGILYTIITILGAVKAYHGEMYKFPVIGDIATSIFLKNDVVQDAPKSSSTEKVVKEKEEFELKSDEENK